MTNVRILKGDLTELDIEAIVNPANSLGYMGGGVAGAIKKKGGKEIEEEAIKKAPIPVGEAIATISGKLRCKYVIHAPTMERPAMRIHLENVKRATRAAFELAIKMGIKSIAFPGMGTGVGGIKEEDAAKVMMEIARDYKNFFDEIIFTDINEKMVNAWKNLMED